MEIRQARFSAADPERTLLLFVRPIVERGGLLLQLLARVCRTNNVNNCSYYCHPGDRALALADTVRARAHRRSSLKTSPGAIRSS